MESENIKSQTVGTIWRFRKGSVSEVMGYKGPVSFIGLGASELTGPEPSYQSNLVPLATQIPKAQGDYYEGDSGN
jgi:hypothetical protein